MRFRLLAIALLLWGTAQAQDITPTRVTDQNRTGDLPFSTSIGTGVEHVDAAGGGLSLRIPVLGVRGRGMDFDFYLRYDSKFFSVVYYTDIWGNPASRWAPEASSYVPTSNGLGWHKNVTDESHTSGVIHCLNPSRNVAYYSNYIYTDPSGVKYPLATQYTQNTNCGNNDSGPDLSAVGIWRTYGLSGILRLADGTKSTGLWTDSNGNQKNDPSGLDTLGRTLVTDTPGTNQRLYTVYDSNGTAQTYTLNYTNLTVSTNFHVHDSNGAYSQEYSGTRQVVTSFVLPDGRAYQFQYESNGYGAISRIDFPTGAYATYTYATCVNGDQTFRYVATRTLTVSGQSSQWTFSRSTGGDPCSTVTVTDPLGNQTVYTTTSGAVLSASIYQGAATGNPLRRYQVDYAYDSGTNGGDPMYDTCAGGSSQPRGQRPIRITTTLDDGRVSKKEFDYETFTYTFHYCHAYPGQDTVGTYTTSRGNVSEIREYDWGQGSPGALVRKTTKSYLHNSITTYKTYNIVNKVLTSTVYDGGGAQKAQTQYEYDSTGITGTSGAPQHDYANYPATFTYRGNVTKVKRWRNTDGALLSATYVYNDLGDILSATDPGGHTTNWSYDDSWANGGCPPPANSQAYATQVTNALSQRVQVSYFPCTGLAQSHKDENDILASRAGTTFTFDLFGRLVTRTTSDGGQTSNSYSDTPPASVTSSTAITGSVSLVSTALKDDLGRVTQTQLTSDPEGAVSVDTTYDALGRAATGTNPYRSVADPTYGATTTLYDALGRATLVIPPDGSSGANNVSSVYTGACTTVTDQAGTSRKSCADALGRLTQVFEPNASGSLIYETDYTYDTLDNLTQVSQKGNDGNSANWRTRTFTYNSLSQLLSATNPESGTINYTYDSDGNVLTKVAPAPNQTGSATVTTSYSYDALHRLTGKTYSNGDPAVSYFYDQTTYNGLGISNGKGRRTGMSDGSGSTAWSYDSEGRALVECRTISGITKSINYNYNLDGSLATLTYPSGRIVSYAYNAAGRALAAQDVTFGINYATAATYAPQGALAGVKYGVTGSFTGIVAANTYNPRLQPVSLSAASPSQTVLSLSYAFGLGTADNGNVLAIQNNRDLNRSQNFAYDQLNRIAFAWSSGALWGNKFTIDIWGNLTNKDACSTGDPCDGKPLGEYLSQAADANNRFVGMTYDAAGNLINDGGNSYTYDAENRISTTAGVTYTYDGDGERVKKSGGKLYWTGAGSDPLAESALDGTLSAEYVFFNGKRIARFDRPSALIHYYFSDHLGSASVVTDATGATIEQEADYYPFGGERAIASGPNNYKFTGKERDSESGLDYFGARYYSSSLGRFLTPDWATAPTAVAYADFGDPQSLNLYGYVRNNPLSHADSDGHCCDLDDVLNFAGGAANAYGSDNLLGAGRVEQTTTAGKIGAAVGDAVATVQGAGETLGGVGAEGGGLVLDATGVGAVVGVPANVAGAAMVAHGGSTALIGGANLLKATNETGGKSSGGPKANEAPGVTSSGQATDRHGNKLGPSGEPQVNTTKSTTREGARNKALNEGSGAVEHKTPKQGDPHFHPTDNKGNKKPSSTHHEYPD